MAKHYYIGSIYERNGDYDYNTNIIFALVVNQPDLLDQSESQTADRMASERLEAIASTWYPNYDGDSEEEIPMEQNESGYYEANGGEVWVRSNRLHPIQHDTYLDLYQQGVIVDFTDEDYYR